MKYKILYLDFNHSKYKERNTDTLNPYKKNKVNYALGEFSIYVDADKVEYGKNKLLRAAADRYYKTIKEIDND